MVIWSSVPWSSVVWVVKFSGSVYLLRLGASVFFVFQSYRLLFVKSFFFVSSELLNFFFYYFLLFHIRFRFLIFWISSLLVFRRQVFLSSCLLIFCNFLFAVLVVLWPSGFSDHWVFFSFCYLFLWFYITMSDCYWYPITSCFVGSFGLL